MNGEARKRAEVWALYLGAATGLVGSAGGIYGVIVANKAVESSERREIARDQIEKERLEAERFKTRLPESHEEATKRVRKFLLFGRPDAPEVPDPKNDKRGFIGFQKLLFSGVAIGRNKPEFSSKWWRGLNSGDWFDKPGVDFFDERDLEYDEYVNYGSEYTGFGPYLTTRGRGRYESTTEEDVLKSAEANHPVSAGTPIYYKLGYEPDFAEGEKGFGKDRNIFSMIRLRIDILKPLEFDGHIAELREMIETGIEDPKKLDRFRLICQRSGVTVGVFKWAWPQDEDGWAPDLGLECEKLPTKCLAIRDEMNAFIYGDQPNAFRRTPLPPPNTK